KMSIIENYTLGAVPYKEPVRFAFGIARAAGATGAMLRLCKDGETPTEYGLVWSGLRGARDEFSLTPRITSPGLYFYDLIVACGQKLFSRTYKLTIYEEVYAAPKSYYGGIMYQAFPDRFCRIRNDGQIAKNGHIDNDGNHSSLLSWDLPIEAVPETAKKKNDYFYGGNLAGVTSKLDYLKSLSADILYLNPVFEARSNHRYDTADYFKIDPLLGTAEDFKHLCKEAKKRGIRVILDGVFSHTGADSVYFDKYGRCGGRGAYQSTDSPYYKWYSFKRYPDSYKCWWDIETLPETVETEPSFMDFICGEGGVVEYWLRLGASGFRLDVADELPDAFIEKLVARAKSVKKDALIIAEVWENASDKVAYSVRKKYFLGRGPDTVMNYPFRNAVIDYIKRGDAEGLADTVADIVNDYPDRSVNTLMNFLGTHDTERILTALENRKHSNASEMPLLYFLPGNPCIYYGDEAGMKGGRDPYNRACFPWGAEDAELYNFYCKLGKLRKKYRRALIGRYRTLYAADGIYIFARESIEYEGTLRGDPKNGLKPQTVLAAFNLGDKTFECDLNFSYINIINRKIARKIILKKGENILLAKE
ncbi:MAG: glycoside hydrolase family 13 protein, partial [Firmicutes bacterium]|nr:glycoside hydrolase family 13 protein [Bacillota bacterium]